MNRFDALFKGIKVLDTRGEVNAAITGIAQDSRLIEPGWLFFARSGGRSKGVEFVSEAARRGAVMLVTSSPLPDALPLPAVRVADERVALVGLSQRIYRYPATRLCLIGVTGTNGKTSSVHLIRAIVEASGGKCGMLSTIGYDTRRRQMEALLTTPDIDTTCRLLDEMVGAGCTHAVMEVSSHALDQRRVEGLVYGAAAFTNLSRDHLDYHRTFANYFAAKRKLFDMIAPGGVAAVNTGDRRGRMLYRELVDVEGLNCIGFARRTRGRRGGEGQICYAVISATGKGGTFRITGWGVDFEVHTPLVGLFQGDNVALAASVGLGLGIAPAIIARGIESLKAVPGRMETAVTGPFTVLVDYSHTPDALERALASLRRLTPTRLTVVFGCGGDRDRTKRPVMGQIAAEGADKVIITSDNPRTEEPAKICAEIAAGLPPNAIRSGRAMVQVDRREAIERAVADAIDGELILLAGKGAETYLEVNGVRTPFDDREEARRAAEARRLPGASC
ncbi:MAG: UDP-N-acetylmuramoyl-L-alanyl-D-glutamate--2,6-diaminopimelate ligase [Calditrichaeota bacterium]|nr:UDP-N-acetylmuramoyl-L-alanyl-D-glutamate--2,6-diaminopimelate ligase [Calditrichota bacterium]